MTGRLGRAASDGAATVEISLDGQGAGIGTGGSLTGQVAADGSVSGRISGRGPDLSVLLPAPSQPWSADGRLVAGGGLLVADDLELTIGGTPARGAVALRLLPQLRLDAALATNRLDLDAWLPPLLHGGPVALPTGIDLSAEAAPFAGATLRRLRAGFDLSGGDVTLRESEATLPGDAALQLSGILAAGRFTGEARITAPRLSAGPGLVEAPGARLARRRPIRSATDGEPGRHHPRQRRKASRSARCTATSTACPSTGDMAFRGGSRPAVAATIQVTGPVLDRWVPPLPHAPQSAATWFANLPRQGAGFDADITLQADRPVWHGTKLDRLMLEGGVRAGTLEVRRASLTGPGLSLGVSGSLDRTGRLADGVLAVQLAHAELLADTLPAGWTFARPLFRGAATLDATASGPTTGWVTTARAELSDLRIQAAGKWDLPAAHWSGMVALHHPGAPRLLSALGLPGMVQWLGDGSLSLQAALDASVDRLVLGGLDVSAGSLRSTGDLALTRPASAPPRLTGVLALDTLPVPLPYVRSTDPLPFELLRAIDARLSIRAAHLLWGAASDGEPASALVTLANGVLRIDDASAHLAGGVLSGTLALDATASPLLTTAATLTGAVLDGPAFDAGTDIIAGTADAAMDVSATGYSPAALFASLRGTASISIRNGAITGFDAGRLLSSLGSVAAGPVDPAALQATIADTLRRGATPFTVLQAAGTLSNGLLTLTRATATTPAAAVTASGSVDLPGDALDLALTLQPALDGAPSHRPAPDRPGHPAKPDAGSRGPHAVAGSQATLTGMAASEQYCSRVCDRTSRRLPQSRPGCAA